MIDERVHRYQTWRRAAQAWPADGFARPAKLVSAAESLGCREAKQSDFLFSVMRPCLQSSPLFLPNMAWPMQPQSSVVRLLQQAWQGTPESPHEGPQTDLRRGRTP